MKAIVACDFHVPFVDDKWLAFLLKKLKADIPDKLIISGDFLDLYSISRFDSAPCRADDLEYELTIAREILQKFRDISKKMEIVFIVGNHEARMETFLSRGKNKALFNLACLKIENLLNFNTYKVTKIDHIYHLNDSYIITHGSRCGLTAAQAECLSFVSSGMSGHVHKHIPFRRHTLNSKLQWDSLPCMCDIDHAGYAINIKHTWENGFAEIEYAKDTVTPTILTRLGDI
jgi:hypothetical protein